MKTKILVYLYNMCRDNAKATPSGMGFCSIESIPKALCMEDPHGEFKIYETLQELYSQSLIMKDPYHSSAQFSITLTSKGRIIAEKRLDIDKYSLRLENFIERSDLLEECQDLFNDGRYETAVFSAYRLLEVKIREKANLDANLVGRDLINEALSPKDGILRAPSCATKAEETGIHNLFLGGISSFKNPTSHRIIHYDEPRRALQAIILAELLLSILDSCVSRDCSSVP